MDMLKQEQILAYERTCNRSAELLFPKEHLGVADRFLLNLLVRFTLDYLKYPRNIPCRFWSEINEGMRELGYNTKPSDFEC
jgi:hypothetical protein